MNGVEVVSWPTVRDAMYEMHLSQSRVVQLIYSGELRAVRTGLGWLVDPESLATLQAKRAARPARGRRPS
jgi:hypothetical protein